jgi:hypothetical protein
MIFRSSFLVAALGLTVTTVLAQAPPGPDTTKPVEPADKDAAGTRLAGAPNGKKLVLKDGNYQLIREYTRNGDRVRYYSLERAAWEEIPASMVDWAATQKAEAATSAANAAEVEKLKRQEAATRVDMALDIDASLQIASGTFLPPGEGMFAAEGKSITPLEQAPLESHRDKKQFLKQVITPIPIVPGKTNIELAGAHAKVRLDPSHLEFYLRQAPPDPDSAASLRKSNLQGEAGPEIELVRANVKGSKRMLEQLKDLFGEKIDEQRKTILIQRWQVAANVFRFTLGEPLPPGEYALAEMLPDGMSLYVWDFGIDGKGEVKK